MPRMQWVALALVLVTGTADAQSWPDLSKPAPAVGGGAKDAALVITIERYSDAPAIPGAEANGRAWLLWLTKTRGVPASRVVWLKDNEAAKEVILAKARAVASWAQPGGTVWLVFVGHGAPSQDGKDGVLVGYDAQQTAMMLYGRSVPQKALLGVLGTGRQAGTVAVVDACFSGRSGSGKPLAPGLQPFLAAKGQQGVSALRATVLSAGTSKQFAGPLPGASRPAFSYLVLGALRGWGDANGDGSVTAQEAVAYAGGVLRTLAKGRTQTPEVHGMRAPALSKPGRRGEKGPDLAALAAAPTPAKASSTFGKGLGAVTTVPTVGRLALAAPKTSLGRVDVTLLKRLQAAKRADKDTSLAYPAVAETWDALAGYPGAGSLKAQAERRRGEWRALNKAVCARRAKLSGVRTQHAADKAKLAELLALDDDVLPRARKAAYQAELKGAYAQWASALKARPDKRARCQGGSTSARVVGKAGLTWVRLPGGTFTIGQQPGPRVTLSGFGIGKTEVTVGQYRACVRAGTCSAPKSGGNCNWKKSGRAQHPINCVDHGQATAFCRWAGARLPTEAEWEYAARSGGKGRKYPWGDEKASCARAVMDDGGKGCGSRHTLPVCSKPAGNSAQGACDLAGNVWEWVSDWYGPYPSSAQRNPPGPSSGSYRVVRGGSWFSASPSLLRARRRDWNPPAVRYDDLGFRCARTYP